MALRNVESPTSHVSRRFPPAWTTAGWLFLPLVGLALFLFGNTRESLWLDEAGTMQMTGPAAGLTDVWRAATRDVHPPLYSLLLWASRRLLGPSPAAARGFSALGAFGLLLVGAWPLRRALGDKTALLFLALALLSPALLAHAQEARMYTWAAFLLTGMAVYLHLGIRDGRRSDWVKAAIFTTGALYVHPFSLLATFFLGASNLALVVARRRDRLRAFLSALGLPALAFLPWVQVLAHQVSRVSRGFWIPPLTLRGLGDVLAYPFGLKFGTPVEAYPCAVLVYAAAVAGLVLGLRRARLVSLPVVCLLAALSTVLVAALFSWAVRPVLIGRSSMPLLGLILIAAAFGLAQLRRELLLAAAILLAMQQLPLIGTVYRERFNGPMREVTSYLDANLRPGDAILHTDVHTLLSFAYYLPSRTQWMYAGAGAKAVDYDPGFANVRQVSDLQDLPVTRGRVWLAQRPDTDNPAAFAAAAARLGIAPAGSVSSTAAANSARSVVFRLPRSWYSVVLFAPPWPGP